jgi:hypothetical protein
MFQNLSTVLNCFWVHTILNSQENRPGLQDENFDILYKARPVLELTEKFKILYTPGRDLAVDETMTGFKGRFILKQYLPGKSTKWGIKAWGIADSSNGYLLKCDIDKGKKKHGTRTYY